MGSNSKKSPSDVCLKNSVDREIPVAVERNWSSGAHLLGQPKKHLPTPPNEYSYNISNLKSLYNSNHHRSIPIQILPCILLIPPSRYVRSPTTTPLACWRSMSNSDSKPSPLFRAWYKPTMLATKVRYGMLCHTLLLICPFRVYWMS